MRLPRSSENVILKLRECELSISKLYNLFRSCNANNLLGYSLTNCFSASALTFSAFELAASTFKSHTSAFKLNASAFELAVSTFKLHTSVFKLNESAFELAASTFKFYF